MSLAELKKRQSILDAVQLCDQMGRENFLREYGFGRAKEYFKEPLPEPSRIIEIEKQLIGDILMLFDEKGLTREQALSLLGQMSVLIELAKKLERKASH